MIPVQRRKDRTVTRDLGHLGLLPGSATDTLRKSLNLSVPQFFPCMKWDHDYSLLSVREVLLFQKWDMQRSKGVGNWLVSGVKGCRVRIFSSGISLLMPVA